MKVGTVSPRNTSNGVEVVPMSPKHVSAVDPSDADIDALIFSLLTDTDTADLAKPNDDTVVRGHFFRRHTVPAAAAATVAAVSIATVWLGTNSYRTPEMELASTPQEITAANLNPELLSSLAKGSDFSGLAEPQLAAECVAVNVNKLNDTESEPPTKSNTFSDTVSGPHSPLERVVGAAPVRFAGVERQLFLLRTTDSGTTAGLTVLITEESCGQADGSGVPEAATVHVAALN